MSVVHERLQRHSTSRGKWYLKAVDGAIYGPVDLSTLADWAAQNRIAPGNMVSENKKNWIPADTIPELKMEWLADLPDNKVYGPFNVLAVPHLVKNGTLSANATLTNSASEKTLKVEQLLKSSNNAIRENPIIPSADEIAALEKEEDKSRLLHEAQLQHELDDLREDSDKTHKELEVAKKTIASEEDEIEHIQEIAISREDELRLGIESLQQEARKFEERFLKADKQLQREIARNEKLEKQHAAKEEKLNDQISKLKDRVRATSEDLMASREDLTSKTQELSNGKKKSEEKGEKLGKDYEAKLNKAEKEAFEAVSELKHLKKEIESQKSLQAEIEKSGSKKESALLREARDANTAMTKAQHELEKIKEQHEHREKQLRDKEEKLLHTVEELKHQNDKLTGESDKLRSRLVTGESATQKIESQLHDVETDRETVVAELKQLQASYESLQIESMQHYDQLQQMTTKKEKEKSGHNEKINKMETQISSMMREIEQLKLEAQNTSIREENARQELAHQMKEAEQLREQSNENETKLNGRIDALSAELESATSDRASLEETFDEQKQRYLALEKEASTKERSLSKTLEILTRKEEAEAEALAQIKKELSEALKQRAELEKQWEQEQNSLGSQVQELMEEKDGISVTLDELRTASAAEKKHLEDILTQKQEENRTLETRVQALESDLVSQKELRATLSASSSDKEKNLLDRLEELENARNQLQQDYDKKANEHEQLGEESAATRQSLETDIANLEERISQQKMQIEEDQASSSEREKTLTREKETLQSQLEARTAEWEDLAASYETLESAYVSEKEAGEILASEMEQAGTMAEQEKSAATRELKAAEKTISKLENTLEKKIRLLEKQVTTFKEAYGKAEKIQTSELEAIESRYDKLERESSEKQAELETTAEALQREASKHAQTAKETRTKLDKASEDLEAARIRIVDLEESVAEKEERLKNETSLFEKAVKESERERLQETEQMAARHQELLKDSTTRREELEQTVEAQRKESERSARAWEREKHDLEGQIKELGEKEAQVISERDDTKQSLAAALSKIMQLEEIAQQRDAEAKKRIGDAWQEAEKSRQTASSELEKIQLESAGTREQLEERIKELEGRETDVMTGWEETRAELEVSLSRIMHLEESLGGKDDQFRNEVITLKQAASTTEQRLRSDLDKLQSINKRLEQNSAQSKEESESRINELVEKLRLAEEAFVDARADLEAVKSSSEELSKQATHYSKQCDMLEQQTSEGSRSLGSVQSEMKQLRSQYEPLLKEAQKQEKILLKKVQKLEAEKAKKASSMDVQPKGVQQAPGEDRSTLTRWVLSFSVVALIGAGMFVMGRRQGISKIKHDYIANLLEDDGQKLNPLPRSKTSRLAVPGSSVTNGGTSVALKQTGRRPDDGQPLIHVDQVKVTRSKSGYIMVFEFGIFTSKTSFAPRSMIALEKLADQLRAHMSDYKLIIEGHTDVVPASGSSNSYLDNYELGMDRAKAVYNVFKTRFNLPPESMSVTSAGETDPPYSNNDPVSRRKNRTVILKLTKKERKRTSNAR